MNKLFSIFSILMITSICSICFAGGNQIKTLSDSDNGSDGYSEVLFFDKTNDSGKWFVKSVSASAASGSGTMSFIATTAYKYINVTTNAGQPILYIDNSDNTFSSSDVILFSADNGSYQMSTVSDADDTTITLADNLLFSADKGSMIFKLEEDAVVDIAENYANQNVYQAKKFGPLVVKVTDATSSSILATSFKK